MKQEEKTVAATEIKNRFGDYLGEVVHGHQPLMIERHGKTVAVLVGMKEWKRLKEEKLAKKETPWIEACIRLSEKIRKNHPNAKTFSAVELIREIRDEEES